MLLQGFRKGVQKTSGKNSRISSWDYEENAGPLTQKDNETHEVITEVGNTGGQEMRHSEC